MIIKSFNQDILELYYISNLLQAQANNDDIFHCGIYLICKHNLQEEVFEELNFLRECSDDHNDIIRFIKYLVAMDPSYNDFINFKSEWKVAKERLQFSYLFTKTAPAIVKILRNKMFSILQNEPVECDKIDIFKNFYGFDEIQIELIRFAYCIFGFSYSPFAAGNNRFKNVLTTISIATSISFADVYNNLTSDSKLVKSGIIEINTFDIPRLAQRIFMFIEGKLSVEDLMKRYSVYPENSQYPLESFSVDAKQTKIITRMISSESHFQILLYGEPGTGKTEYSKSIASAMGKRPRFLLHGNDHMGQSTDRLWALHVTLNTMADDDLLIIDEADRILNTENYNLSLDLDKGQLNTIFDTLDKTIIWITNDIKQIHRSLLRRFGYSIRFEPMGVGQREIMWKNITRKYAITLSEENIRNISQQYKVNAGVMAHASNIAALLTEKNGDDATSILEVILDSYRELINGVKQICENSVRNVVKFNAKFLNTDVPVERLIKACALYAVPSGNEAPHNGMCSIFYGLPGTGKSETAKYIASQLNIELIQKKYSDLVSMWVGETESNIANAFKEAEKKRAILFIDEADALFTERSGDLRSWEISRTNEFLSQIDSFNGILICCTNLVELFDKAIYRRFALKINFLPVKNDERLNLYNSFFEKYGELSQDQCKVICNINTMTPGDVRVVATSIMYEDNVTHSLIINLLKKECDFKDIKNVKRIGF